MTGILGSQETNSYSRERGGGGGRASRNCAESKFQTEVKFFISCHKVRKHSNHLLFFVQLPHKSPKLLNSFKFVSTGTKLFSL